MNIIKLRLLTHGKPHKVKSINFEIMNKKKTVCGRKSKNFEILTWLTAKRYGLFNERVPNEYLEIKLI